MRNELIERLNRLLRMTVPVPAGCVAPEGTPMTPGFCVSVQLVTDDGVHFIIHANGHSSDTLDLVITDHGLALLPPFKPGESQSERIARAAYDTDDRIKERWQPIETAPQVEGREVLGFALHYGKPVRFVVEWNGIEWYAGWGGSIQPTHWQPLPEPPALKGDA